MKCSWEHQLATIKYISTHSNQQPLNLMSNMEKTSANYERVVRNSFTVKFNRMLVSHFPFFQTKHYFNTTCAYANTSDLCILYQTYHHRHSIRVKIISCKWNEKKISDAHVCVEIMCIPTRPIRTFLMFYFELYEAKLQSGWWWWWWRVLTSTNEYAPTKWMWIKLPFCIWNCLGHISIWF